MRFCSGGLVKQPQRRWFHQNLTSTNWIKLGFTPLGNTGIGTGWFDQWHSWWFNTSGVSPTKSEKGKANHRWRSPKRHGFVRKWGMRYTNTATRPCCIENMINHSSRFEGTLFLDKPGLLLHWSPDNLRAEDCPYNFFRHRAAVDRFSLHAAWREIERMEDRSQLHGHLVIWCVWSIFNARPVARHVILTVLTSFSCFGKPLLSSFPWGWVCEREERRWRTQQPSGMHCGQRFCRFCRGVAVKIKGAIGIIIQVTRCHK